MNAARMVIPLSAFTFVLVLGVAAFPQSKDAFIEPTDRSRVAAKWAVLVGVNDYERCSDLKYCRADVTALRDTLARIGFDKRDVTLLSDGAELRPSRRNILEQLDTTLKVAGKDDMVVIALSGHGAYIKGKSYFCPADARPDDPERTMIPIEEIYARLKACPAKLKLVLVDACRNQYVPSEAKSLDDQSKSIDGFARSLSGASVPQGVVLMASCMTGERSWEEPDFGHGVFMHFVLEGLSGKADAIDGTGKKDDWVSLFELCDYVNAETKRHVLRTRRVAQRPYYHAAIDLPDFRLARALPQRLPGPPFAVAPFDEDQAKQHQTAWAEYEELPVMTANSIGMKFMYIPPGEFLMGSPETEEGRRAVVRRSFGSLDMEKRHRVKLSKGFYLGAYEVTQGEWNAVMDSKPWTRDDHAKNGSDYPVVYVSWVEAVDFCEKLSEKEGKKFRLPTEAEWEYACRAGTTTAFYFGEAASRTADYAWCDIEYAEWYARCVGQKRPNAWGLYDMHGNVSEFCFDCLRKYEDREVLDPRGPATGLTRACRGGHIDSIPARLRSAYREGVRATSRHWAYGFRVVLVPESEGAGVLSQNSPIGETVTRTESDNTEVARLCEKITKALAERRPSERRHLMIEEMMNQADVLVHTDADAVRVIRLKTLFEDVTYFWRQFERGILKLAEGDTLTVNGTAVNAIEITDTRFTWRMQGLNKTVSYDEMPSKMVEAIATLGLGRHSPGLIEAFRASEALASQDKKKSPDDPGDQP